MNKINLKEDEIIISEAEASLITKMVNNRLNFVSGRDPEVKNGTHSSYSTVLAQKIKEKFNLVASVSDGKKFTKQKVIIFMKCPHGGSINVSMPSDKFVEGSSLILQVKQKEKCLSCRTRKNFF